MAMIANHIHALPEIPVQESQAEELADEALRTAGSSRALCLIGVAIWLELRAMRDDRAAAARALRKAA